MGRGSTAMDQTKMTINRGLKRFLASHRKRRTGVGKKESLSSQKKVRSCDADHLNRTKAPTLVLLPLKLLESPDCRRKSSIDSGGDAEGIGVEAMLCS